MAKTLTLAIFVTTILAALHQTTVAQELHVVGDSLGWIVPPGGPIAYSTWASLQTFNVGDILMFNFTTGQQDVAMVTKEAYDACKFHQPTSPSNHWSGQYYPSFRWVVLFHWYHGQALFLGPKVDRGRHRNIRPHH